MNALFRCPGCGEAPHASAFPLCSACSTALVPCPALCPRCGSPACAAASEGDCLRPWAASAEIRSYAALYLLAGRGYEALRRWKVRLGPLFDRRVLDRARLAEARRLAGSPWPRDFRVVPVPQDAKRAWSLGGGSPAGVAARWLAREAGMPLVRALRPEAGARGGLRQAERPLGARLANRIRVRFDATEWKTRLPGEAPHDHPIVLVDDFVTSGHTVRSAARVLGAAGVREIHVFCLGVRPMFGPMFGPVLQPRGGRLDAEASRGLLKRH